MRNIRFVGLIQRLNCVKKSSTILTKSSVCNSNAFLQNKNIQACGLTTSSNTSSNSSGSFYGTAGTLVGAALFGTLAYQVNENSKKNVLYAKEESIDDRIEEFLKDAKKDLEEVKEIEDEVKAVIDEAIVIDKELKNIGENIAKAGEHVAEIAHKVEEKIEDIVEEAEKKVEEIGKKVELVFNETKTENLAAKKEEEERLLPEIPSHVQYLIVGGGTAAMSAFKSIRANDENAKILVVTEEDFKPYMRPPLSKDLWTTDDDKKVAELRFKQYNGNERSLYFLDDEFYVTPKQLNQLDNGGVAVLTGKRVMSVDSQKKTVKLDNSWEIAYDKCLIATGGKPKSLPAFQKFPEKFEGKVTLFRNIKDFEKLNEISKQGKTIAIVGGGFLGSELACALAHSAKKNGGKVIQMFPEGGNLQKILPEYLTKWTTKKIVEEGVSVIPNARIVGAQINDEKVELQVSPENKDEKAPKSWVMADHVVVAVGLDPSVDLATNSGFEVDPKFGGFVVNAELQARNSVWVAGDAACFYDIKLGRRRVEHHDHAVVSGRLAGENMTGACKPYWHQSMFWSDLGPRIGFEAIGLVDSSLQTVGLFAKADETDAPEAQANDALRSETEKGNASKELEAKKVTDEDEFGTKWHSKLQMNVGLNTKKNLKKNMMMKKIS